MKRRELGLAVFGLCVLSLACGCREGNPLGRKAVSGTVKLDGAPVKSGGIDFQPMQSGGTSSGAVITDGNYSIAELQGLPVGKYRVRISATDQPAGSTSLPAGAMPGDEVTKPAKELVPDAWNAKGEQIEVKADGPNKFDFDISTKSK